jgi:hypothetical protein
VVVIVGVVVAIVVENVVVVEGIGVGITVESLEGVTVVDCLKR